MEQQQLDSAEIFNHCDESKCVSRGRSDLNNDSFTCYGDDGTSFPMMCADGFVPIVVDHEPPSRATGGLGGSDTDTSVRYFTCCPPVHLSSKEEAIRHCSDPIDSITSATDILENDDEISNVCNDQTTRSYPRRMKSSTEDPKDGSFICCDSDLDTSEGNNRVAKNFLDTSICVPYRNESYEASKVHNSFGHIDSTFCDFPEGDFRFSRPVVGNIDVTSSGLYQCCKNGPDLPPFVLDSAFQNTLYVPMVLSVVAAIASAVVAVGLLIPLIIQLRNGTYQRAQQRPTRRQSRSASAHRSSEFTFRRRQSRSASVHRSSEFTPDKPCYSTYNLYLVYLATPDFIFLFYRIITYGRMFNQNCLPESIEAPMGQFSATTNLWLNAIVTYQVLALLRSSKNLRRVKPPSLTKVNLQGCAVYLLGVIMFCFSYFVGTATSTAENDGDLEKLESLDGIFVIASSITGFAPIFYVVYVSLVVWCRGYLPSLNGITGKDRAMRELFFYFFRIVAVFILIWLPGLGLLLYNINAEKGWVSVVIQSMTAIQAIVTTCMILTKPDARGYILDLVTLSYLFGTRKQRKDTRNERQKDPSSLVQSHATTSMEAHSSHVFKLERKKSSESDNDIDVPCDFADFAEDIDEDVDVESGDDADAGHGVGPESDAGSDTSQNEPRTVSATGEVVASGTP